MNNIQARAARALADAACSATVLAALGGLHLHAREEVTDSVLSHAEGSDETLCREMVASHSSGNSQAPGNSSSSSEAGFQALAKETTSSYKSLAYPLASTLADVLYGHDTTTQNDNDGEKKATRDEIHDSNTITMLQLEKSEDNGCEEDNLSDFHAIIVRNKEGEKGKESVLEEGSDQAAPDVKAVKTAKTNAMNRLRDVNTRVNFHNAFEAFVVEVALPSIAKDWDSAVGAEMDKQEAAAVGRGEGAGASGADRARESEVELGSEAAELRDSGEEAKREEKGKEHLADENDKDNKWLSECWVQSFPCVRVLTPGEFSLPPHCDSA